MGIAGQSASYLGSDRYHSPQVLDEAGEAVPLSPSALDAKPLRDVTHLPGCSRDDRTLDKLVDKNTVTCDDKSMWLAPFTTGASHTLHIQLPTRMKLRGLRLWNYNKTSDDTYRGVRWMAVTLDGADVVPPTPVGNMPHCAAPMVGRHVAVPARMQCSRLSHV